MELKTYSGYNLYDMSSMLQKAIRRGDVFHASFAAKEMHVKYREYMWRRLLTVSAEDCYGIMTKEIVALWEADQIINGNKCKSWIFIAKAVTLLCMARKNRDADYVCLNFMCPDKELSPEEINEFGWDGLPESVTVPDWVYDCHTRKGKMMGKTKLEMVIEENAALQPHQLNLFDDGDFGQMVEDDRKHGKLSRKDEQLYKEYSAKSKRYY